MIDKTPYRRVPQSTGFHIFFSCTVRNEPEILLLIIAWCEPGTTALVPQSVLSTSSLLRNAQVRDHYVDTKMVRQA